MLGVCEGYDRVEAVSECGLVSTTSTCLLVPLLFLLCVADVIGGIVVHYSDWSPAILRPMSSF